MDPDRINEPSFYIGQVPIYGNVIMSPMDGFTDHPYRVIARRFGSAMCYTEYIDALDLLKKDPDTLKKIFFSAKETPIAVQLLSNDVEIIQKSAAKVCKYDPDFIDINIGCSAKSISNRGAGAGLMKHPAIVANIINRLVRMLKIPILAKIRLGWDEESANYLEIAKIVEDNGGALIAIHGRTRIQNYRGNSNWDAIGQVKNIVSIPVLGNGDIKTVNDIERMITYTNCDGVLIGRASIGNPWIFSRQNKSDISRIEIFNVLSSHLDHMIEFYGDENGIVYFRKHLSKYISQFHIDKDDRLKLLTSTNYTYIINTLESLLS